MKNVIGLLMLFALASCADHATNQPAPVPVVPSPAPVTPVIPLPAPETSQSVELHWLDGSAPAVARGISWGVPWPQGKVQKDTLFDLTDSNSTDIPTQSWPLAYWPDGSIKWTGFSATADSKLGDTFTLTPGKTPPSPTSAFTINQTDDAIEITNGQSTWRIGRNGANLVQSISLGNQVVATNGSLVGQVEDRADWDTSQTLKIENFTSDITSAAVEQTGPIRTVIKIEGKHKFPDTGRMWLPFVVRLYFYAGVDSVRMVHTFIFDGDQEKDFIRGLGIQFDVPMREQFQNRHVRIAGDQGFFAEPVQLIVGRRDPHPDLYAKQIAGKRIPNLNDLPASVVPRSPDDAPPAISQPVRMMGENVAHMAVWDAYKLVQLSPDGFEIQKRTNPKSAWINVLGGQRSMGLAFVGDVSGGLAIDLKNFWKLWPTELEIQGAGKDVAHVTAWLWSPDAPAMDMRHYDIVAHDLEASYEDITPGYSSAFGIARTSELTLHSYSEVPSDEELLKQVQADQQPPLLVCSPEYYHSLHVFGLWSLPDRSTPARSWVEDQLGNLLNFYQQEVEHRRWYGFWDFGDVMHTYDTARHEWKYDVGGFAWDNTELAPPVWFWYSFLRTGRADIYRMAEALTRQSQETDVYHLGPWKGLGSRHNVRHWGDGSKELRISQAIFKRFYYYLTTDERTGDLMNEEIDADQALLTVDPVRKLPGIANEHQYPTHIRIGPDWLSLAGNWYVAWERTGDPKYRDYIQTGIDSILALPQQVMSGENFGYDPATKKISMIPPDPADHAAPSLLGFFGGPELIAEINPVLNDPAWTAAWTRFCASNTLRGANNARLGAYAAYIDNDPKKAAQVWRQFLATPRGMPKRDYIAHRLSGPNVPEAGEEINNVSTNDSSQWSLNAIELTEMIPKAMPTTRP